jgi:nucleoside-diphosphate-sugar epimerase
MILRAPGIYAADRLPIDRLRAGTPALQASADSYSNHVHADDLARLAGLALFRGRAGRVYHACDDAHWRMGDWFDAVADATGLPRPVRLPAAAVQAQVSPTLWSFMRESRRLSNLRAKQELRWRLCYSTPMVLLQTLRR